MTGYKNDIPEVDNWHTDGSVGLEGRGAGVYRRCSVMGFIIPMGDSTTSTPMELMYITQCIRKTNEVGRSRVVNIVSGSMSAIQGLANIDTKRKLVREGS